MSASPRHSLRSWCNPRRRRPRVQWGSFCRSPPVTRSRLRGRDQRRTPVTDKTVRELEKITVRSDTRDVLAHAAQEARRLADYFVVDIDAHVTETAFWSEITDRIDNDYLRHAAKSFRDRGGSPPGLLNAQPGMLYQDMFSRIPHGQQSDAIIGEATHRQIELPRRAMDSM